MRKRSWQGIDKSTRLLPTKYASNKVGAKSVEEGLEQNTDSQSSAEGKALCSSTTHILHLHPRLIPPRDGSWLEVNCVLGPVSRFYDLLVQSFSGVRI